VSHALHVDEFKHFYFYFRIGFGGVTSKEGLSGLKGCVLH
jgi:hypothetical protein